MNTTCFLFIDFQEIIVILVVVVMLFGTKSLPEIARGLGIAVRQFREAADGIKREILDPSVVENPVDQLKKEVKESLESIENEVKNETQDIQKSMGSIEGTITRDA